MLVLLAGLAKGLLAPWLVLLARLLGLSAEELGLSGDVSEGGMPNELLARLLGRLADDPGRSGGANGGGMPNDSLLTCWDVDLPSDALSS